MSDMRGRLIGLERPSKRKPLAGPPLSSINGGGGKARGCWGCLIGSWSSGGDGDGRGGAWRSCWAPALHFTGRRQQTVLAPGPRQPQVSFVVCHHGSCETGMSDVFVSVC